ncbi:MAG: hypothetical protein WDN69_25670 [Aliidongia sp.]
MTRVTPQVMVDLIRTFPQQGRESAERDLAPLMRPPYPDLNCKLHCHALPVPIGLLEYALRFGGPDSVELLLEAGIDPNVGVVRPMTVLCMAQACGDTGRIEKLEALLRAGAQADYFEIAAHVPPTPLIALARSKSGGIQRYWMARQLRAAGATAHTANDYELRAVARLLGELRAVDGIMECLSMAEQESTKATPSSFRGLVDAVLRSGQAAALRRLMVVKKELKLELDFDATAALLALSIAIADHPVAPTQAEFAWALIEAGAEAQPRGTEDSAFERALGFENHELIAIFIDAGAKPGLASEPVMAAELVRRRGLPQQPLARPLTPAPAPHKALTSLDLLCSGIEALESCPDADLDRLSANQSAAMRALAERLHALANKLAPVAHGLPAS